MKKKHYLPRIFKSLLLFLLYFYFQNSDDLGFNFIAMEKNVENENTSRKRSAEETVFYSYVKRPMTKGIKLIKIEVYDLSKKCSDDVKNVCKCRADICVQHVVKNRFIDDTYSSIIEIISKLDNNVLSE